MSAIGGKRSSLSRTSCLPTGQRIYDQHRACHTSADRIAYLAVKLVKARQCKHTVARSAIWCRGNDQDLIRLPPRRDGTEPNYPCLKGGAFNLGMLARGPVNSDFGYNADGGSKANDPHCRPNPIHSMFMSCAPYVRNGPKAVTTRMGKADNPEMVCAKCLGPSFRRGRTGQHR